MKDRSKQAVNKTGDDIEKREQNVVDQLKDSLLTDLWLKNLQSQGKFINRWIIIDNLESGGEGRELSAPKFVEWANNVADGVTKSIHDVVKRTLQAQEVTLYWLFICRSCQCNLDNDSHKEGRNDQDFHVE